MKKLLLLLFSLLILTCDSDSFESHTKKFITSASFIVLDEKSFQEITLNLNSSFTSDTSNKFNVHIMDILISRGFLLGIADHLHQSDINLDIIGSLVNETNKENVISRLDEIISFEHIPMTDIYTINVVTKSNNDAPLLIEICLETLSNILSNGFKNKINNTINFLETRLSEQEKKLEEIDESIQIFYEKNGFIILSEMELELELNLPEKSLELKRLFQSRELEEDVYIHIKQELETAIIQREHYRDPIILIDPPTLILN